MLIFYIFTSSIFCYKGRYMRVNFHFYFVFYFFTIHVIIYACKSKKCKVYPCTGRTAHRGSRGIALLFHDHGTRRE